MNSQISKEEEAREATKVKRYALGLSLGFIAGVLTLPFIGPLAIPLAWIVYTLTSGNPK